MHPRLQPDSHAGKIRQILDENPNLTNAEVAERVGPCRWGYESKEALLPISYIAQVRRKFGYGGASTKASFKVHFVICFDLPDGSYVECKRTSSLPFAPTVGLRFVLDESAEDFGFETTYDLRTGEFHLYCRQDWEDGLDQLKEFSRQSGFKMGKIWDAKR